MTPEVRRTASRGQADKRAKRNFFFWRQKRAKRVFFFGASHGEKKSALKN